MPEPRHHRYSDGTTDYVGYLAEPEGPGPHPAVMIAPAFMGLRDFEMEVARTLAGMGYVGFGMDYYGDGFRTEDRAEASGKMQALNDDRQVLADRMTCALEELRGMPSVDGDRIAVIGYCLGGKAVLDLARTGADFRLGVSLHGIFDRPNFETRTIRASLLMLHGWEDTLAKPPAVVALAEELTEHCEDWDLVAFGHTGHAFTNPAGANYRREAADRSWRIMTEAFTEHLSG